MPVTSRRCVGMSYRSARSVRQGRLQCRRTVGAIPASHCDVPYDPQAHRYLRIRHKGDPAGGSGFVVFETAFAGPGGPDVWVERQRVAWDAAVPRAAARVELRAGTDEAQSSAPGTVRFDNVLITRQ